MKNKRMKNILFGTVLAVLGAGTVLAGCGAGKQVEFTDPLVERCVRMELGKTDEDAITAKDCASLKKLTIDCDLEHVYLNNWYSASGIDSSSYVDLCDLQYMTGLEELVIDNDVSADTLVNMDALKKCTKMESLTMRYNPMERAYYGTLPMGYKYLADIIAKMPKLTYLNLGYNVAEEYQELLAGDNTSLEIEDGHSETAYYDKIVKGNFSWSDVRMAEAEDVEEYQDYWTVSYDEERDYKVPLVLAVTDQDELDDIWDNLPEDTEDIHLLYDGVKGESLSLEGVKKFANLKTFSMCNIAFWMVTEDSLLELEDVEALAECKKLYSVSLAGVKGDLDQIGQITSIKELGFHRCKIDDPDFLVEFADLGELIVVYNVCDDMQDFLLDNGESFAKLRYLRYEDSEGLDSSAYKGIEKYPALESLSISYSCGVDDVKYLAKCPKLSYLFFGTKEESLDIEDLKDLISLEYLFVDAVGDLEELTGVEEVVGTRIISFRAPFMKMDFEDRCDAANDWIEVAVENENLSCFVPLETMIDEFTPAEAEDMIDYEDLYEQDILCRMADLFMHIDPETYPTMDDARKAPIRD